MGRLGKAFAGVLATTALMGAGSAQAAEFTEGGVNRLVPASETSAGQVGLTFRETGLKPGELVHYSLSARMRGMYVGPWQYTLINRGKDVMVRRDHGQVVQTVTQDFTARADSNGVVSGARLASPVFTPLESTPSLYWLSIWGIHLRDVDHGVVNRLYRGHRYRNVCNKDGEAVKCSGIVVT